MLAVTLRGVWANRSRLVGTVMAVALGVSFLAGALALSDTLRANFDQIFTAANAGTDAVVQSSTTLGSGVEATRTLISSTLVSRVRQVPGVADAQAQIVGYGELIGANGKGIGGNGPPRLAGNWITDPALNPYLLVAGRPPNGLDEVVINRGAAVAGHLHVGQVTVVDTPQPVIVYIAGIATFGTNDGIGKQTFTAFSLAGAEKYVTGRPGQTSSILVKADRNVTQAELVSRLQAVLPAGIEAISGTQSTANDINALNGEFLNFLSAFLIVFAAIALVVASFTITNTFSILVAQRTRDTALLRLVGATRRQVHGAVLTESALVGAFASGLGLAGGLAIAAGLKGLFDSFGFSLPARGLVVRPTTVWVSMVVGTLLTVVAGLAPAARAARVAPLEALRHSAAEPVSPSRRRTIAGMGLGVVAVSLVVAGARTSGSGGFGPVGLGAAAAIAAMVLLGPAAARRAVAILGWPLRRCGGAAGELAADNARRNPRRSAAAATALMVGVTVVTLFTVLAASFKTSITTNVNESFTGQIAVTSGSFGGGGLSPQLAAAIGRLPQVDTAAALTSGDARLDGTSHKVSVIDPTRIGSVLDLHTTAGTLASLGDDHIAVSAHQATASHLHVGAPVTVTLPDGSSHLVRVGAVYPWRDVVGDYLLPVGLWAPHVAQNLDATVFVKLRPGGDVAAVEAQVRHLAASYGNPSVVDHAGFVADVAKGVTFFVGIVYALLALAVVIAVLGIANTLSLSIHERRREIGVLRAVGQTRRQLRAMIRLESATLAVFGALGGVGLGTLIGWGLAEATSHAQDAATFTAPTGQLLLVVALGALAGIMAAIRPARRAAQLPVLAALAES